MICYALYYKDKDGFDVLLNETDSRVLLYTKEDVAKKNLEIQKARAYAKWRPEPVKHTKGMLWWKEEYYVSSKISPVEAALGRQIYTTIGIKKVKVV